MEKNNIFEKAKFGDKFLTRDGRIAIYQKSFDTDMHCLMLEEDDGIVDYFSNGNVVYEFSEIEIRKEQPDDIVSKYQEPINEEELNELGHDLFLDFMVDYWGIDDTNYPKSLNLELCKELSKKAYRAGYIKANNGVSVNKTIDEDNLDDIALNIYNLNGETPDALKVPEHPNKDTYDWMCKCFNTMIFGIKLGYKKAKGY